MTASPNMVQITVARGRTVEGAKPGSLTNEPMYYGPGEKLFVSESDAQSLVQSGFAYRSGVAGNVPDEWLGGPPTSMGIQDN